MINFGIKFDLSGNVLATRGTGQGNRKPRTPEQCEVARQSGKKGAEHMRSPEMRAVVSQRMRAYWQDVRDARDAKQVTLPDPA